MRHRSMRARLATALSLLAVVVAGCAEPTPPGHQASTAVSGTPSSGTPASGTPSGGTTSSRGGSAVTAPRMWASFPVAANPRPIILLGEAIVGPEAFPDGDSKLAFLERRVRLAASLPTSPTVRGGYPLLTARQAFDQLRSSPGIAKGPPTTATVVITDVALADHNFLTDRGTQSLPAWRMRLRDVTGDVYVLAVAPSARYSFSSERGLYDALAIPSADGRQLTINFIADHRSTGPCDPAYTSSLQVVETHTTVVLAVAINQELVTLPPNVVCPAVAIAPPKPIPGAPGTRTITLALPLGGRVVVDSRGTPYIVTAD